MNWSLLSCSTCIPDIPTFSSHFDNNVFYYFSYCLPLNPLCIRNSEEVACQVEVLSNPDNVSLAVVDFEASTFCELPGICFFLATNKDQWRSKYEPK